MMYLPYSILLHILTGLLLHTDLRFVREIVCNKAAHIDEFWTPSELFHFEIGNELMIHLIPPLTVDFDHNITQ